MYAENIRFADDGWAYWVAGHDTSTIYLHEWVNPNGKIAGMCRKLLAQFTIFGVISIPIGMSFYVRNLVKFNMSMFWVYEIAEDSWQYTGNVPVINRFLWPIPADMLDNLLHFRLGCGYNVWMQIIRTSVLGEWDMANVSKLVKILAVFLMLIGAVLAFVALCCFVKIFIVDAVKQWRRNSKTDTLTGKSKTQEQMEMSEKVAATADIDVPVYILFVGGYLVNMFCYLTFAYNYPQQCSMNFRYITILLLFPAVALGMVLQESEHKWFHRMATWILAVFSVCSVFMIGFWGLT